MATEKTKEKQKEPKKFYIATVKVKGMQYTAEGKTVSDAIRKLKPGNVNGMAILTVTNPNKEEQATKEAIIPEVLAKKLFNTAGASKDLQVKNASSLFDGL